MSALHRADPDVVEQRWNRFEEHTPAKTRPAVPMMFLSTLSVFCTNPPTLTSPHSAENTGSINRTGTVHFRKTSVVTMLGAFMGSRASATTASCRTHQITLEFAASDRLPFLNQEEI